MTRFPLLLACLLLGRHVLVAADVAEQAAKDARVVETLLRLKGVDVNTSPRLKSAVLRHLAGHRGTEKYVDLAERLDVRGIEDELVRLAIEDSTGGAGVKAATLLLKRNETARFAGVLSGADSRAAAQAAEVLGLVGNQQSHELLRSVVSESPHRAVRVAAATALGRNRGGQRFLLHLVRQGRLPAELNFSVANALYSSPDPAIRSEVAKHLKLPAASNSKPLPPIAELVRMSGTAEQGFKLFQTTASCAKCHKVDGQGKEVGPNLSEIGSKLSREAFFVSILDPSAGISHNYETHIAVLENGNILSGVMVNRTDESITLRTADAIDKKIGVDEIEEITKSNVSLMPADIQKTLSVQELVDVVEYLITLKKKQ